MTQQPSNDHVNTKIPAKTAIRTQTLTETFKGRQPRERCQEIRRQQSINLSDRLSTMRVLSRKSFRLWIRFRTTKLGIIFKAGDNISAHGFSDCSLCIAMRNLRFQVGMDTKERQRQSRSAEDRENGKGFDQHGWRFQNCAHPHRTRASG